MRLQSPIITITLSFFLLLCCSCHCTSTQQPAARLISAADLAGRLQQQQQQQRQRHADEQHQQTVVIEVGSPNDLQQHDHCIDGAHCLWRPDYDRPVTAHQPLTGLCPTCDQFTALAQRLGIQSADTHIVLVDHTPYDATRLWWLFVLFGKRPDTIWLVDGGFAAVQRQAGIPWQRRRRQQQRQRLRRMDETRDSVHKNNKVGATWKASPPNPKLIATAKDIQELQPIDSTHEDDVDKNRNLLWDVRSPDEYHGRVTLQGAVRPGRIPWAKRRVDWSMFRRESDGTWLPPDQIRRIVGEQLLASTNDKNGGNENDSNDPPNNNVVHTFYCQSGVRTTQLIFGMALAGWPLEQLRNYDGSWVEWSRIGSGDSTAAGGISV